MVKVIKFLIGFIITITVIVVGFCIYVINADNSTNPIISTLNSLIGDDDIFTTISNVNKIMDKVDMDTINSIKEIASDSQKLNDISESINDVDFKTLIEINSIVQNIDPDIIDGFKDIVEEMDINSLATADDVGEVFEVIDLSTMVEISDLLSDLDNQTKTDIQNQVDNIIGDDDVSNLISSLLK